jgi:hypothetical protein
MRISALSLALGLWMAGAVLAAEAPCGPAGCEQTETCGQPGCCAHCGQHCCCDKYCQVVCTTKEVKKVVWVVKCEEYCRPCPGCPLGRCNECCDSGACAAGGCETKAGCDTSGKGCCSCDPCAVELAKRQTPPKCGPVHCRKILEKKEIVCQVPTYKCVVVYCCPNCTHCESGPAASPAPAPAPAPRLPAPPPPKTTDLPPRLSATGLVEMP